MASIRCPRTLDASLPPDASSSSKLDLSILPLPVEAIPTSTKSLRECALYQIRCLIARSQSGVDLTPDEEDELDDGFVLCDLGVVQRKLHAWRRLFPRIKPFFALKCNPDIMVAAVLGQHKDEVGYDCASISEIKLALHSTGDIPTRCVYANPQRAEGDLDAALALGVEALTFDGLEELRKVSQAHKRRVAQWEMTHRSDKRHDGSSMPPKPPEMILRIVVPDSGSNVPLGAKFGAHPEKVVSLTEAALDLGLPIIGVSFHCGSGCHDPNAYGTAIRLAKEAIDAIDRTLSLRHGGHDDPVRSSRCSLLDIGGGYPGLDGAGGDEGRFCVTYRELNDDGVPSKSVTADEEETTSNIADVVRPLIDELFPETSSPLQFISEPGRYFVESAFALCSRIYSARTEIVVDCASSGDDANGQRRHYYIAQGVHGVFKDVLLCGEVFNPIPLQVEEKSPEHGHNVGENVDSKGAVYPSTVHGPSGEDFDIVCAHCSLPELKVGDWLIFDRMGAYTLSIAARSGNLPVRYVVGEVK